MRGGSVRGSHCTHMNILNWYLLFSSHRRTAGWRILRMTRWRMPHGFGTATAGDFCHDRRPWVRDDDNSKPRRASLIFFRPAPHTPQERPRESPLATALFWSYTSVLFDWGKLFLWWFIAGKNPSSWMEYSKSGVLWPYADGAITRFVGCGVISDKFGGRAGDRWSIQEFYMAIFMPRCSLPLRSTGSG